MRMRIETIRAIAKAITRYPSPIAIGLITSSKNIRALLYVNYFFFQMSINRTIRVAIATAASALVESTRYVLTTSSKNILESS